MNAELIGKLVGTVLVVAIWQWPRISTYLKVRMWPTPVPATPHRPTEDDLHAVFERKIHTLRMMAPELETEAAKRMLDLCDELSQLCGKPIPQPPAPSTTA